MIRQQDQSLWDGIRKTPLPVLVLCFVVLLFMINGVAFYLDTSSDDSYYMPRAMEIIAQNCLAVSHSFGWYGKELPAYNITVDASTLEFLRAYLSRVTGMHITILSRNGLQIALLVISMCSIWTLLDVLTQDHKHAFSVKVYGIILWLSFLLLTFTEYSGNYWVANLLWQGKSMLPGMVFPLLFAACACIMQHIESFRYREWLSITLLLIASVSVSSVGLFLTPILYVLLGAAFLIVTRFRHFKRIAPCAVVSALPVLAIVVVTYYQVVSVQASYFTRFSDRGSWISQLFYSTDRFALLLFLVCAVWVLRKGTKVERALFVVMPALLLVTFLNPLLRSIVSTYVTTETVYWRLFWLIPVTLLPVYWIPKTVLYRIEPAQLQRYLVAACASIAVIAGCQWGGLGLDGVTKTVLPISTISTIRDNPYRISHDALCVGQAVTQEPRADGKRPVVLYYYRNSDINELRQYSADIVLATGLRDYQIARQTDLIPGTDVPECDFYAAYHSIEDGAYLHDMLTRLRIDYVCFHERSAVTDPERYGFTPLYEGENLVLWRVDAV